MSEIEWTVGTLKEHLEEKIRLQDKAVTVALLAAEKAVAIAETNAEKWRMNANEWRSAMGDREEKFVQKEHMNPLLTSIQKEVNELKVYVNLSTGKTVGMDKMWGYIVAAAGSGGLMAFILERFTK